MTSLSDTLTVGLVLVLLFGSIALYLYTRIQQSEQKITLLESILLDLKMSAEVKTYSDLPADEAHPVMTEYVDDDDKYVPFTDKDEVAHPPSPTNSLSSKHDSVIEHTDIIETLDEVTDYKNAIASAIVEEETTTDIPQASSSVTANYEAMTLKELQALAKTRGIMGANSMKKGSIIEALRTSDKSQQIEPGSMGNSGSFLESSSFLGQESS